MVLKTSSLSGCSVLPIKIAPYSVTFVTCYIGNISGHCYYCWKSTEASIGECRSSTSLMKAKCAQKHEILG
jgi:hypothetical protein